ncbi:MAG: GAF domain-containing protein, partial [Candidatus Muiribacteriaceae bacterium]
MLSRRIKFLFELIHELYKIEDFKELINHVVDKTSDILKASRVSLMLYNEENCSLKIVASKGVSSDIVNHTEISLGEHIAGIALRENQCFFVENIDSICRKYGISRRESITSKFLIVIPLVLGEKFIGILNVTDIEEPGKLSERDRDIILSISSHIAQAIERLRLLEFQKVKIQQAVTLFEISKTLNSYIEIDDTLDS